MVLLFVAASLVSGSIEDTLHSLGEEHRAIGMVLYVGIAIVATVLAPLSAIPLIPIATALWGWQMTAFLSVVGWVIGAQIAFGIARRYGAPIVARFVSMERIRAWEKYVPQHNVFMTIVILRMLVPVDILSYALGLFSRIQPMSYFFATLIGVTPGALYFAYVGSLPVRFQLAAFVLLCVVLGIPYYRHRAKTGV